MYDLVDRPVTGLAPGGRFLLQAMRGWIHAATIGQCPPGLLAPAFARHGVLPALPPFHHLMLHFNHRALGTIAFAPLTCARIGEDEAVEPAFAALLTMAARLRVAGLGAVALIRRGTAAPH